ncbi:hypothetical protein CFP56_024019 [Quercus suber]|uniref:Uncharacterized protein n=1 Tax=Quercus suber TaxID=58331 RepID=A0AAW0K715_QUESU
MHHPAPTACGALRADSVGAKPNMEQQHQHNKRKRKPVFVFGNYKNYYGYRVIFLTHPLEKQSQIKGPNKMLPKSIS